VKILINTQI